MAELALPLFVALCLPSYIPISPVSLAIYISPVPRYFSTHLSPSISPSPSLPLSLPISLSLSFSLYHHLFLVSLYVTLSISLPFSILLSPRISPFCFSLPLTPPSLYPRLPFTLFLSLPSLRTLSIPLFPILHYLYRSVCLSVTLSEFSQRVYSANKSERQRRQQLPQIKMDIEKNDNICALVSDFFIH